jgi:hypothetical protein
MEVLQQVVPLREQEVPLPLELVQEQEVLPQVEEVPLQEQVQAQVQQQEALQRVLEALLQAQERVQVLAQEQAQVLGLAVALVEALVKE